MFADYYSACTHSNRRRYQYKKKNIIVTSGVESSSAAVNYELLQMIHKVRSVDISSGKFVGRAI